MNRSVSRLVFFVAALLWGASYVFQKPLLDVVSPITFTFWNFFISGVLFLIYALVKRLPLAFRWKEGVVLGFMLSGIEIFEMTGLQSSTTANAVFLTNFGMLLVPFTGWMMFRHTVKLRDVMAIMVAIAGMYFLVGGLYGFSYGDFFLLLSALSCAFYFVYSERFEKERASHVTTLCVQQFAVISGVCLAWNLFVGGTISVPHAIQPLLLLEVLVFTTIPYAIIQWASQYADEMIAAVYDGIMEPLAGSSLSWFVFLEAKTPLKMFGGALMIGAFAFAALYSHRHFLKTAIKGFMSRGVYDTPKSITT